MKKILSLLSILCLIFTLCSCGNSTTEPTNTNEQESTEHSNEVFEIDENFEAEVAKYEQLIEDYLAKDYSDVTLKIGRDSFKTIDLNYIKEYYKILRENEKIYNDSFNENFESDLDITCTTIDIKNNEFPILVIKSGDNYTAYEYKDGVADKIDASNLKIDEDSFVSINSGSNLFESAMIMFSDLYKDFKEKVDSKMTFSEAMEKYLTTEEEIYYGSAYSSITFEDGSEIEQKVSISLGEDNDLIMNISDTEKNIERDVTVTGIEEKIVKGEINVDYDENNATHPDNIYELTEKGNIYAFNIPEKDDTVKAKKLDHIKEAIDFIALVNYPTKITKEAETGFKTSYYALNLDGKLSALEK